MHQEKLKFYVLIINVDKNLRNVDKNLRKAIIKRSALQRKASGIKQEGFTKYKKQRNLLVKLNKERNFNIFKI